MRTAIIGVGNKLMGDEGVGVHAVEYLRSLSPSPLPLPHEGGGNKEEIDLLDAGTGGMALFHLLEKYERVIIIDAADFGGRPGEIKRFVIEQCVAQDFSPANIGRPKGLRYAHKATLTPDSAQVSLHGTSLAGILQLAEKLGTKMPEITVIAVQPEYIGCKLELSPAVKKSLDKITEMVNPPDA